jgi:hypothetical protein
MQILWLIISLIPVPFLFHFYEYQQHIHKEEAPFLMIGFLLFIFGNGVLSNKVKIRYLFLVNGVTGLLSILLASRFIPDDGAWFTPFGRDVAVIFISIVYFIGQLLVRMISRFIFQKK